MQIAPDGALLTYLKPEPGDQTTFDLWERPVKGGKETLLVDGSKVEPKDTVLSEVEKSRRERERTAGDHGVIDYKWDDVGTQILIPASGELYLANAKTGDVRKLGDTAGGASDAKISPRGGYVTYVRDQNLHTLDIRSGQDVAITTEGQDAPLLWYGRIRRTGRNGPVHRLLDGAGRHADRLHSRKRSPPSMWWLCPRSARKGPRC